MEKPTTKTIEKLKNPTPRRWTSRGGTGFIPYESHGAQKGPILRFKKGRTLAVSGFTLVELLVVISIIGLLASTVLAALNDARAKARDAARTQTIAEYKKAFSLAYDVNGGSYPNTGGATVCIGDDPNDVDVKCGYSNESMDQSASVNDQIDNYLLALPVTTEATYIAFSILWRSEGITYACSNPNCTKATIYWVLEKDSSCPGGEKYSTWNIMCRYILD